MDENVLEAEEVEKATKKAAIAEIKLVEIIGGAFNCQLRTPTLGNPIKGEIDNA